MRLNTPTESGLRLIIADRSLRSGPRGAQMPAMLTHRPCAGVGLLPSWHLPTLWVSVC